MKKTLLALAFLCYVYPVLAQWEQVPSPVGATVTALANSGDAQYAGTTAGLYKMQNGKWEKVVDNVSVTSIVIYNGYVFAGTASKGVYRSLLTNNDFVQVNNNLSTNITQLYVYKGDLLATGGIGVYKTTDNGNQWTNIKGNLPSTGVRCIVQALDSLYIGTNSGVFVSHNYGTTWKLKKSGTIVAVVASGSTVVASDRGSGLYWTDTNGDSWTSANTNLPTLYVERLYANGNTIYASTDSLYTSNFSSLIWSKISINKPMQGPSAYDIKDNNLWLGSVFGVLKQENGTFTEVNNGFPNLETRGLFTMDDKLLLQTEKGLWSRGDDSKWSYIRNIPNKEFKKLIKFKNTYAASNTTGLYILNTSTNTWTLSRSNTSEINSIAAQGDNLYISTATEGILRSTDGGTTWSQVNIGITGTNVRDLMVLDSYLFALGTQKVYKSSNNGDLWTPVRDTGSFLEKKGNTLYLVEGSTTNQPKIWKSEDFGTSWKKVIETATNYSYVLQYPKNLSTVGSKLFIFDQSNIYASIENDTIWYRFNRGYADAEKNVNQTSFGNVTQIVDVGSTAFIRNTSNHLWKRSLDSFVPPAAPSNVTHNLGNDKIFTAEWTDNSNNETSFGIRRYWDYADISVTANKTSVKLKTDTLTNSPGYFVVPVYIYANMGGDWSSFARSTEKLRPPFINDIEDVNLALRDGDLIVDLAGIAPDGGLYPINVTAESLDPTIVSVKNVQFSQLSTEGQLTLTPLKIGTTDINVTVTAGPNNSTIKTFKALVTTTVGIEEELRNGFTMFPNPASRTFNMAFGTKAPRTIAITTLQGQHVRNITTEDNDTSVNIADFVPGLYVIKVKESNKVFVQKLMVD